MAVQQYFLEEQLQDVLRRPGWPSRMYQLFKRTRLPAPQNLIRTTSASKRETGRTMSQRSSRSSFCYIAGLGRRRRARCVIVRKYGAVGLCRAAYAKRISHSNDQCTTGAGSVETLHSFAMSLRLVWYIGKLQIFQWNMLPPCCSAAYCLLTYLLTPRSRVLLEKLAGFQLLLPTFYGTRRFITAFTRARHLSLSWARSIQSMFPHPNFWRSILILSSHLRLGLPSGLFP